MTPTPHAVTVVVWGDAHLNALDEAEAQDVVHRGWEYMTVGLLVRSDATGVTLAMDRGEDGKYRTRTFIPRAMVIEEYGIGTTKRRRERKKPSEQDDHRD